MSVPTTPQATSFLRPLRGRTTAFIVSNRETNLRSCRFLLACLSRLKTRTIILDTSVLYSSNIGVIAEGLGDAYLEETEIVVPRVNARPEDSLCRLTSSKAEMLIIDDINALHNLLSMGRQRSAIHTFFTYMRVLSCCARLNNLSVVWNVYRSETSPFQGGNPRRSLSAAADLQVTTIAQPRALAFRCEDSGAWSGGTFLANVPSSSNPADIIS